MRSVFKLPRVNLRPAWVWVVTITQRRYDWPVIGARAWMIASWAVTGFSVGGAMRHVLPAQDAEAIVAVAVGVQGLLKSVLPGSGIVRPAAPAVTETAENIEVPEPGH